MNKNVFVVALVAFIGCFASTSVLADDPDGYGYYVVARNQAASPMKAPPTLGGVYEGKWLVANQYAVIPDSSNASFRLTSAFRLDSQGAYWVATGTYTVRPGAGSIKCGTHVNIPMYLRWNEYEGNQFVLLAVPQDDACMIRRFQLVMDVTGRLSWTSKDGQESVYFDPKKS